MSKYNEDTIEQATLLWLQELGYTYIYGLDISPGEPAAERNSYRDVILTGRLLILFPTTKFNYPQFESELIC